MERGKVHKCPKNVFVTDKESTANIDKVEINLKFSLIVLSNKNNITKTLVPKLKNGSPEEMINW
eukprot:5570153-Ditylum_brightwellii.AAC.2